jgi:NADPH2 dehydrogenase
MSGKYKPQYPRVAQLKTAELFAQHLEKECVVLEFDAELTAGPASPFAKAHTLRSGRKIGNAMCILPMEGWDGTEDGRPTELTKRRWKHFGLSGAKLLWGCEAVAVRPEGRANPNQLMLNQETFQDFVELFELVESTHQEHFRSLL